MREAQLERLRTSTCTPAGTPNSDSNTGTDETVSRLEVVHFAGMFVLLFLTGLGAILGSTKVHSEADRVKEQANAMTHFFVDHSLSDKHQRLGKSLNMKLGKGVEEVTGRLSRSVWLKRDREEKIAMKRLAEDLISSRPLSAEEWQSGVDQRLAKMDSRLGKLCDKFDRNLDQANQPPLRSPPSDSTPTAPLHVHRLTKGSNSHSYVWVKPTVQRSSLVDGRCSRLAVRHELGNGTEHSPSSCPPPLPHTSPSSPTSPSQVTFS